MPSTPLVCIPGTLCDERVFQAVIEGLGAPVLRWRYQQFAPSGDALGCAEWAEWMLTHLPPRFALMGFSLGGLLALSLSERAPHRVAGLALVASNAEPAKPSNKTQRTQLLQAWADGGAAAVVAQLSPRYGLRDKAHEASIQDMARGYSLPLFDQQLQFAADRPDRGEVWRKAAGPALLISGEQDTLCPAPVQQRLHDLRPDAHWLHLSDSGHFPLLDDPLPCRHAVQQWAAAIS